MLDDEREVWHCEYRDNGLLSSDIIEYWAYIEKNNFGYYASDVFTIDGNVGNFCDRLTIFSKLLEKIPCVVKCADEKKFFKIFFRKCKLKNVNK